MPFSWLWGRQATFATLWLVDATFWSLLPFHMAVSLHLCSFTWPLPWVSPPFLETQGILDGRPILLWYDFILISLIISVTILFPNKVPF